MSSIENMASQAILNQIGVTGSKEITSTDAVTPATGYYFFAIQVMADTVVAAQGDISGAVNADLTGFTKLPVGVTVYGKWNSITLTSGEVIAYYAKG